MVSLDRVLAAVKSAHQVAHAQATRAAHAVGRAARRAQQAVQSVVGTVVAHIPGVGGAVAVPPAPEVAGPSVPQPLLSVATETPETPTEAPVVAPTPRRARKRPGRPRKSRT